MTELAITESDQFRSESDFLAQAANFLWDSGQGLWLCAGQLKASTLLS